MRSFALLFALFSIFYLGTHFWLRWRNTAVDDGSKISRLVDCQPSDIRAIRITQEEAGQRQELSFARDDQAEAGLPPAAALERASWRLERPMPGEADADRLRRISATICELYDPILLHAEDFRQAVGGARHALRLEAELESGGQKKAVRVDFGLLAPDMTNIIRFQSGSGVPQVAKIPARFLETISLPISAYQNLRLMRGTADNVEAAAVLERGKEKFRLERGGAGWHLFVGGIDQGSAGEEAERFVNRLSSLRAIGIEEAQFSRAQCEALKADLEVALTELGRPVERLRFQFEPGGPIAACSSARSSRLRIHQEMRKYLETPASSLHGSGG